MLLFFFIESGVHLAHPWCRLHLGNSINNSEQSAIVQSSSSDQVRQLFIGIWSAHVSLTQVFFLFLIKRFTHLADSLLTPNIFCWKEPSQYFEMYAPSASSLTFNRGSVTRSAMNFITNQRPTCDHMKLTILILGSRTVLGFFPFFPNLRTWPLSHEVKTDDVQLKFWQ